MIFGIPYAEWIGYIAVLVLVVLFGLPNGWLRRLEKYYSSDHLHKPISDQNVSMVALRGAQGKERKLKESEAQHVIALFNEARLVQKMEPPSAPVHTALRINQKTGGAVEIMPYRSDVLVVREERDKKGKPIAYWAKQDELAAWLHTDEERTL